MTKKAVLLPGYVERKNQIEQWNIDPLFVYERTQGEKRVF